MSKAENYLEELEAIKSAVNSTEIKISTVKGRSDSTQEEIDKLRGELEDSGYTFNSIQEIEDFRDEKEARINELIRNYKSELSMD